MKCMFSRLVWIIKYDGLVFLVLPVLPVFLVYQVIILWDDQPQKTIFCSDDFLNQTTLIDNSYIDLRIF